MSGILDLRQCLDLIYRKFLKFRTHFEFLNLDDFYGHYLAGLLVGRLVHLTELALAYDVLKDVVFDLLAHGSEMVVSICL